MADKKEIQPLPWSARPDIGDLYRVIDSHDVVVFACVTRDEAELIVSAVNSHAELLAALKDMTAYAAACMRAINQMDQGDAVDILVEEVEAACIQHGVGVRAKAAITKAEGR